MWEWGTMYDSYGELKKPFSKSYLDSISNRYKNPETVKNIDIITNEVEK